MKQFWRIWCCGLLVVAGISAWIGAEEKTAAPETTAEKAPSATSKSSHEPATEQRQVREEPKTDKDVPPSGVTADDALRILKEGNARFIESHTMHPNQDRRTRYQTASHGQDPFAVIVTCSDSRVPPDIIFDQGIGDLFIIRTAGHVCDEVAAASVEYGADHLKTPLIVVLGHTGCGAVTAAAQGGKTSETMDALIDAIKPAIDEARARQPKADEAKIIEDAIETHVHHTIRAILDESPVLKKDVDGGKVMVAGAIYDMKTGKVRWLAQEAQSSNEPSAKASAEKAAP